MPPKRNHEEITCTITGIKLSRPSQYSEGKHWYICYTDSGYQLSGEAESNSILTGCKYRCSGYFDEYQGQKQFKFQSLAIREPASRHGVVQYLSKHAAFIGHVIANRLCDKFGPDNVVGKLRESPDEVAAAGLGLNLERCKAASDSLKTLVKFEETRIALMDLLDGKGFRKALIDQLIEKFGSAADKTVRLNPFVLVEERFPGCGFSLVDQLYMSLGLDPASMTRQVYGLVYVLENLADNSTWGRRSDVYTALGKILSKGMQFQACIDEAIRLNKIKTRVEGKAGVGELWLACKQYADQESMIAEMLWEIGGAGLLGDVDGNSVCLMDIQKSDAGDNVYLMDIQKSDSSPLDDILDPDDPFSPNAFVKGVHKIVEIVSSCKPRTKPDIRDVKSAIPKSLSVMDQDDDLCFEVDATVEPDESYDEAQELIEELDGLLEQIEEIDAAADYFESCTTSLAGISEYVERKKTATEKQLRALENMCSDCERWIEGNERGRGQW